MELGAVTESISVEATAPLLQTESSTVGAVVENRTIVNMPLINRRAAQLARLTGFVVQNGTGSQFSMAGGRGDNAMWLIDGGTAQNVTLGVQTLSFDPPVESLQEFKVNVSNYAAELGRTGGGVVQMTTKSGTNAFHGSVYEYLRNDALDARTFFAADKAKLRYNLLGASLGGPIRKDRTHFFYNYEGRRVKSAATIIQNIPTPAETRGDFSGSRTVIRDPAAAGRPPFPGNIIPAGRLDPIGLALAAFYPAPNVPGRPSGSSNFRTNREDENPVNTHVARVDHMFTEKDRVYGRLLVNTGRNFNSPVYATPGTDQEHRIRNNSYYNASATWFHNLGPATINEFRWAYSRRVFINRVGGTGTGLAGKLGIRGVNPEDFPRVILSGYAGIGGGSNHLRLQTPIRSDQYANYITHIRGSHSIKAGFEYRYNANDDVNQNRPGGEFSFNNTATGHALAALLLGWAQRGRVETADLVRSRADTWGAFVQDDWKVTPRVTLNLGLRYDLDQPRWEAVGNRQNSFDREAINPVSGTPGIILFSGRNGLSRYAHNFDKNNFGPRLGFAWRAAERWVIRGGGALIYTGQYDQATPIVANIGFSVNGDLISPDNGLTPALLLRDGLPAFPVPRESDLTPGFGAVPVGGRPFTSIEFFEPGNRRNGYLETFNFNIEHQIAGNMALEIGYLATLGHKLPAPSSLTLNQVRPELMGPGNAQVRRPYPQFSNVVVLAPAIGNSNYHGVNLKLEKRYSHGLHFNANYTWSRLIDDAESRNEPGGSAGNGYMNVYDRRQDRGLAGWHVSHRFIWSSVYELPVGRGKALDLPGTFHHVLGGWSLGYIAEFRSGLPYGVIEQVNRTNGFSPSQRPNVVGDPKLPGGRPKAEKVERWFDTNAFAQSAQYTFGNAGRTAGFGPGAVIMDLSILKDFRIADVHGLQFRCEMLNFINHANFALPNLSRGNTISPCRT
ncbi:MAG: TonB-dependent receptor [Acidobacteria bacterium]|nr:TonB-dependent receptor [Acidobacteriota bacterium]